MFVWVKFHLRIKNLRNFSVSQVFDAKTWVESQKVRARVQKRRFYFQKTCPQGN